MISILRKDTQRTDIGRIGNHVKSKAGVWVMQPCAKEYLRSLGAWRDKKESPRDFGGSTKSSDLWPPGLWEYQFLLFKATTFMVICCYHIYGNLLLPQDQTLSSMKSSTVSVLHTTVSGTGQSSMCACWMNEWASGEVHSGIGRNIFLQYRPPVST